jgi:hypothetical protein
LGHDSGLSHSKYKQNVLQLLTHNQEKVDNIK